MSNQDRAEGGDECECCGRREPLQPEAYREALDTLAEFNPGPDEYTNALNVLRMHSPATPQAPGADTPGGRGEGEAVEREDDYIVPKSVYEDMLAALADREAIGFISEESLAVLLDKDGYQKWVEICNTNSGEGKPRIPLRRGATAHVAKRIEGETPGAGVLAVMDRAHMELLISDRFDEASEIGLARESISSLLYCSKALAKVYDAMGSPRGPSRIMLDAAIARCKGTAAQADTHPAESSGGDAVDALRAEVESLRLFANEIMGEWWEGDLDGGSRQDIAERHGLIAAFEVTEPCGDHCNCAELGEWPTNCYRRTPLLTGEAAIASGAEGGPKKQHNEEK